MITILQNTDLHNLPHVVTMNVFAHEVGHSFGAKVKYIVHPLLSYSLRKKVFHNVNSPMNVFAHEVSHSFGAKVKPAVHPLLSYSL